MKFDWIRKELESLSDKSLYRKPRLHENIQGTHATVDGREVILFSGNNYLNLSQHPKVIEAAKCVLETHGVGARSARLISGTTDWHVRLEERMAKFLGKERALVFSAGYLTNVGTIPALAGEEDLIIMDKLNHASLIDAAKLSSAAIRVYPHLNMDYLEKLLKGAKARRIWIVTDSVFSMDGDLALLPELIRLKNQYGAYLVVDEAHGVGVFGKNGCGVCEYFGISDEVDVLMGTLSKAIGGLGGFVAGKTELIEYLINHARTFLFATALPPSICAACVQAIDLIESEPVLRQTLWRNVDLLMSGLKKAHAPILETRSPIIPVIFGDEKKTLDASKYLFDHGFFVPAIRYPTVAKGKARLRITLSSAHTEVEIQALVASF